MYCASFCAVFSCFITGANAGFEWLFFTKGWSNIPDCLADELMVSRPLGWWYQTVVLGISSWITVKSKDFSAYWGRTAAAASAWHFTWKSTHHECMYVCFVCVPLCQRTPRFSRWKAPTGKTRFCGAGLHLRFCHSHTCSQHSSSSHTQTLTHTYACCDKTRVRWLGVFLQMVGRTDNKWNWSGVNEFRISICRHTAV